MRAIVPKQEEFDELLKFMPLLSGEGFKPIIRWEGGVKGNDGSFIMPWPEYEDVVKEFFSVAARDCWTDPGYKPEVSCEMLRNYDLVGRATLDQVITMLTFCVRGERFCDGHWAAMIEERHIRNLLTRLRQLRPM